MKSVGIDIGQFRIKVAEVESRARAFALTRYFEVPLNPEPGQDGIVARLEALRKVLGEYDPKQTRFVVSIRQEYVSLRHKIFPFKERHKLLKSLPFELEDEVPFDSSDALFEAKTIRYRGNASEILALVAPKPRVKELLDQVFESGLDPDIISVEGMGLANILEEWIETPPQMPASTLEENSDKTADERPPGQILIDIGHTRTLIAVVHERRVISLRTIYFGGADLIEGIRKRYSIPYADAVKALTEKGFVLTNFDGVTQDQRVFSETMSLVLKKLVDEVRVFILDIQSEFGITIERVGLSGGTSQLINLPAFLTQSLELPCNPFHFLNQLPQSDVNLSEEIERRAAIAVGLALEGIKKPRNPAVNFRKQEFERASESLKIIWNKWKLAAQIGATVLVLLYVYAYFRDDFALTLAQNGQEALSKQAKAPGLNLKGPQATLSGIKKFIQTKQHEISDKEQLMGLKNINSAADVMADLSKRLPPKDLVKVDITRFFLLEETLTIEGHVPNPANLASLRRALESISTTQKLTDMKPTAQMMPGQLAFAFQLKVDRRYPGGR